jgi:hypothetical protein
MARAAASASASEIQTDDAEQRVKLRRGCFGVQPAY